MKKITTQPSRPGPHSAVDPNGAASAAGLVGRQRHGAVHRADVDHSHGAEPQLPVETRWLDVFVVGIRIPTERLFVLKYCLAGF